MKKPLTAEYLDAHIHTPVNPESERLDAESAEQFGNAIFDAALQLAAQKRRDGDGDDSSITVNVPVTLTPFDTGEVGPLGGCIEICAGVLIQVCWHRGYKGDKPGKG